MSEWNGEHLAEVTSAFQDGDCRVFVLLGQNLREVNIKDNRIAAQELHSTHTISQCYKQNLDFAFVHEIQRVNDITACQDDLLRKEELRSHLQRHHTKHAPAAAGEKSGLISRKRYY